MSSKPVSAEFTARDRQLFAQQRSGVEHDSFPQDGRLVLVPQLTPIVQEMTSWTQLYEPKK
jgi:hypothetical protein